MAVARHHNGERYALTDKLAPSQGRLDLDPDLVKNGVETRAAVAILNRSIRIVSGDDRPGEEFPASTPENPCVAQDGKGPCYWLGGHVVFRQGFKAVHINEFKELGQGGRMAHYPVHFHMARQTPARTYVQNFIGQRIDDPLERPSFPTQGVTCGPSTTATPPRPRL